MGPGGPQFRGGPFSLDTGRGAHVPAGGIGGNHGNFALQIKPIRHIKMESENKSLEAALLDQRMRSDKHKTNFEALKAQHLNLQEVSDTASEHISERAWIGTQECSIGYSGMNSIVV